MKLSPALLSLLLVSQAVPAFTQPRCLDITASTQEKVVRGNRERPAVFSVEALDPNRSVTISARICNASLTPLAGARLTVVEYTEKGELKEGDAPSAVDLNPNHPGAAFEILGSREDQTSSDGSIVLTYHPIDPRTKKQKKVAFLVDWGSVDQPKYLVFNFSWSPGPTMGPVFDPGKR